MLTKHIKPSYGMLVLVFFLNMIIFLLVDIFFKVSGSWFIVKNISSFLLDDIFHFGLWRPNSTFFIFVYLLEDVWRFRQIINYMAPRIIFL